MHGLRALLEFTADLFQRAWVTMASRSCPARVGDDGEPVLLEELDRRAARRSGAGERPALVDELVASRSLSGSHLLSSVRG